MLRDRYFVFIMMQEVLLYLREMMTFTEFLVGNPVTNILIVIAAYAESGVYLCHIAAHTSPNRTFGFCVIRYRQASKLDIIFFL